jgi:hypothetical protein
MSGKDLAKKLSIDGNKVQENNQISRKLHRYTQKFGKNSCVIGCKLAH